MDYWFVLVYIILFFNKPFLFILLKLIVKTTYAGNFYRSSHEEIDQFTLADMDKGFYIWYGRLALSIILIIGIVLIAPR